MAEILPCPFCGTDAPNLGKTVAGATWYFIECRDCPAIMEDETEAAVVAAWNTRPSLQGNAELVERVALAIALSDYPGEAISWPRDFSPAEVTDYRTNAKAVLAALSPHGDAK